MAIGGTQIIGMSKEHQVVGQDLLPQNPSKIANGVQIKISNNEPMELDMIFQYINVLEGEQTSVYQVSTLCPTTSPHTQFGPLKLIVSHQKNKINFIFLFQNLFHL